VTISLSKLTALEAALEYLIKATPGERLEYLTPGEKPPGETQVRTTRRGARGYYPSEVVGGEEEAAAPREAEPTEEREIEAVQAPKADFIVDEDGDKHAFGGGITGPIDLTEQISTVDFFGDARESAGGIWGDEMPRYWYHRPPSTEAKGAEDGGIKAYVPVEEGSVHYKFRGKGTKVVWIAPQPWVLLPVGLQLLLPLQRPQKGNILWHHGE